MNLANVFSGVPLLHGFHGFLGPCFSSIGDIDMQCCFSMGANFLPHIPSIVSVPTGPGGPLSPTWETVKGTGRA